MIEAEEALAGVPWVSPDDLRIHGCRKGRGVGFVGESATDFRLAPPCVGSRSAGSSDRRTYCARMCIRAWWTS